MLMKRAESGDEYGACVNHSDEKVLVQIHAFSVCYDAARGLLTVKEAKDLIAEIKKAIGNVRERETEYIS